MRQVWQIIVREFYEETAIIVVYISEGWELGLRFNCEMEMSKKEMGKISDEDVPNRWSLMEVGIRE